MKTSKILKSILTFSTVIAVFVTSILPFKVNALSYSDSFMFNNSLYSKYIDLKNDTILPKSISDSDTDILNYDATDVVGIEVREEDNTIGQISQDSNGKYIYTEINKSTDDILLNLDNQNYLFVTEGENIYMIDENGNKTIVSEMIYHTKPKYDSYENIQEAESIQTFAWSKEYGPFRKTNKSIVTVLQILNAALSLCKVSHPILGAISVTVKGAKMGFQISKTLYIEYYQAMDGTKVKERQVWYENSDYTKYVSDRTIYFDSVRPTSRVKTS